MPNYQLSKKVLVARHALALDEERDSFRPLLWDETGEDEIGENGWARLLQVWFAGVHANVGGGYPDDTLSYVPLEWIMEEAEKEGLRFSPRAEREVYPAPNVFGPMYDSRAGVGAYYRYQPRKLRSLLFEPPASTRLLRDPRRKDKGFLRRILIHYTVFDRIKAGDDLYAPTGLAEEAAVVTAGGTIEPITKTAAAGWETRQEWVWNDVWKRRVNFRDGRLLDRLGRTSRDSGWVAAFGVPGTPMPAQPDHLGTRRCSAEFHGALDRGVRTGTSDGRSAHRTHLWSDVAQFDVEKANTRRLPGELAASPQPGRRQAEGEGRHERISEEPHLQAPNERRVSGRIAEIEMGHCAEHLRRNSLVSAALCSAGDVRSA
jgi:hypothetical protein